MFFVHITLFAAIFYKLGSVSYIQPPISYNRRVECCRFDFLFVTLFHETRQMAAQLIISTSIDLVRIAPERIVYISSDGNYSTLIQADGEVRMLSFQLGQIEKMINSQLGKAGEQFIRIGKSLIINRSYIYYINIPRQKIVLSDVGSFSHTVTASKEALKQLKEHIEKEVK